MATYLHRFEGSLPIGTRFGFGWWSDSSATLSQAQTAAVAWLSAFWTGTLDDFYDTNFAFTRVSTALITQGTGKQQNLAEDTVSEVGVTAAASVPADMAIVVSLRTDTTARVGRGRFYVPGGLTSTIVAPGRVSSTFITALMAALDAAWTGYVATGTPVIYSRTDRQMRPITSYDVGDLWDTQRRRENKAVQVRVTDSMPT